MKELLVSQIAPIIATAIVAILVKIVYKVGDAAIELLVTKKKETEQILITSGHEQAVKTAKEVWNIVEEKFRITENAITVLGSKADYFDKLLLQHIPGLTEQNLHDLRQAIAGEFNKGKEVLTDTTKVIQENEELKAKNQELQAKLNQINSLIC